MIRLHHIHTLVITSVVIACAPVGPDYREPELDAPTTWASRLQGGLAADALAPESLATWWRALDDPVLSQLIARTIDANLDLRTAESQLRQARAERARSRGALFPMLGDGR